MAPPQLLAAQWFVNWALEASLYFEPDAPGLTREELLSLAERFGFKAGEITDRIRDLRYVGQRLQSAVVEDTFIFEFAGDRRSPEAYDFIREQLEEADRAAGRGKGRIPVDVLLARGTNAGVGSNDLRVMLAFMRLGRLQIVVVDDGIARLQRPGYASAAVQIRQGRTQRDRDRFEDLVAAVEDTIRRRADVRSKHVEPILAFGDIVERLGFPTLRIWWQLTSGELRIADPSISPTVVTVLSAACAEAALMMVADYRAKANDPNFSGLPADKKAWGMKGLLNGAQKAGIFGSPGRVADALRSDVDQLIEHRQRIHVARVIDGSVTPDLKPEQATRAKHTLEALLRAILEWHAALPK